VAYVQLQGLKRADAGDTAYSANVKIAQGLLAQTDSTLGSVETQLQRAQELAVQASNGTLTASNRAAIVTQLGEVTADLLSLANARDSRGQPLFGGGTGDSAYVQAGDGTIAFAGAGDPAAIPVGDNESVHATIGGDRAFGDMFAVLQALSDAISSGSGMGPALDGLKGSIDQVADSRALIGARAARLDLTDARLTDAAAAREETRSGLEDADVTTTVAELQKTLTILQATQASFTKLSNLSLFDYLK